MNSKKIILSILLVGIISGIVGFFIGRSNEIDTTTRWIKGETVHDTVPKEKLVPKYINVPTLLSYAEKQNVCINSNKDTDIITTNPINKDSAMEETVKDWNLERVYKDYLFESDTLGTLEYNINVQYNRIKSFSYNYTPIYKEVTKERKRTFIPYASASYSTFNIVGVGLGTYYHNLGIGAEYQYNYDLQKKGLNLQFSIKF